MCGYCYCCLVPAVAVAFVVVVVVAAIVVVLQQFFVRENCHTTIGKVTINCGHRYSLWKMINYRV